MEIEIKDIIYNYRKDNRLTQEEFGNKLGVTKATVSQWETGKRVPSVSLILEISEKTGIDPVLLYKAIAKQKTDEDAVPERVNSYVDFFNNNSYRNVTAKITMLAESIESLKKDLQIGEDDQRFIEAYHAAPDNIKESIKMLLGIKNEN